jgi:hypothetical protein
MNTRNRPPAAVPADALTGTIKTEAFEVEGLDTTTSLAGDMTLEQIRDSINKPGTIDLGSPDFKNFADELAFMNEQVVVVVHESQDKNAEKVINVFNDGVPQRFVRGQATIVRRKYVEVLARSKPFSVATPEETDGNGDRTTNIRTTAGLMYPFEMRDKNPRGQQWLQRILAEA